MKRVIVVNGVARSGKDTFVNFLEKSLDSHLFRVSSISSVKTFAEKILDVNPNKNDKYRKFLSDIKDSWTAYNNGPFNSMTNLIDGHLKSFSNSVTTVMVREPDEISKLLDYYDGNCMAVLITRSGLPIPDNHADMNVQDYDGYSNYIDNNGTLDEFREKVRIFSRKVVNRGGII